MKQDRSRLIRIAAVAAAVAVAGVACAAGRRSGLVAVGEPGQQSATAPAGPVIAARRRHRFPASRCRPTGLPNAAPRASGNICIQLEQRLVAEGQRTTNPREALGRIENELRQLERQLAQAQSQLERGRVLRVFPVLQVAAQHAAVPDRRQHGRAAAPPHRRSREPARADPPSGERGVRDDIVRELARNGCGAAVRAGGPPSRQPRLRPVVDATRTAATAAPATSSARCRSRPTAPSASASATATTSRSASRRCPTISSATPMPASRSARPRSNSTITRTPAPASTRPSRPSRSRTTPR